jgi:hypothetical protein
LAPFAWAYLLYVTFAQQQLTLFIGAYITITSYMLITIWLDENLQTMGRIKLSGYALVSYFIFYIMDLVQLVDIARCLWHAKSLLLQRNTSSKWISPTRVGGKVQHVYEA